MDTKAADKYSLLYLFSFVITLVLDATLIAGLHSEIRTTGNSHFLFKFANIKPFVTDLNTFEQYNLEKLNILFIVIWIAIFGRIMYEDQKYTLYNLCSIASAALTFWAMFKYVSSLIHEYGFSSLVIISVIFYSIILITHALVCLSD